MRQYQEEGDEKHHCRDVVVVVVDDDAAAPLDNVDFSERTLLLSSDC
jgi:hypothetical protein